MAGEEILYNRYGQALFEAAREEKKLEEVLEGIKLLNEEFFGNEKFYSLMVHPLISREEKKNIIGEILQKLDIGYPLDNFLYLLIDEQRMDILSRIFSRYMELYQTEKQYVHVSVETAGELSPHDKHLLIEALQKKLRKDVEIEYKINPTLLGGAYIRWQNIVYNGTVRQKLATLKEFV